MKHEFLLFRTAAVVALVMTGAWGSGCATSGSAAPRSQSPARPAALFYEDWYDPAAVVLPPPPERSEKR